MVTMIPTQIEWMNIIVSDFVKKKHTVFVCQIANVSIIVYGLKKDPQ